MLAVLHRGDQAALVRAPGELRGSDGRCGRRGARPLRRTASRRSRSSPGSARRQPAGKRRRRPASPLSSTSVNTQRRLLPSRDRSQVPGTAPSLSGRLVGCRGRCRNLRGRGARFGQGRRRVLGRHRPRGQGQGGQQGGRCELHAFGLQGVSATGVSGPRPSNHETTLSTTSWAIAARVCLGGRADMRQQHGVVEGGEFAGNVRLVLEDVEPGARMVPALSGRNQRRLRPRGCRGRR